MGVTSEIFSVREPVQQSCQNLKFDCNINFCSIAVYCKQQLRSHLMFYLRLISFTCSPAQFMSCLESLLKLSLIYMPANKPLTAHQRSKELVTLQKDLKLLQFSSSVYMDATTFVQNKVFQFSDVQIFVQASINHICWVLKTLQMTEGPQA